MVINQGAIGPIMNCKDKIILVVGLARTGIACARFLTKQGARVTVTDMKSPEQVAGQMQELEGLSITWELGRHEESSFLTSDLIVVSPGVPMDHPLLLKASAAGREIVSEVELASRFITVPLVAITGTNGKTTTTTLIGEIFKGCGYRPYVGGNIGDPLIELVESEEQVDFVVAEISSFQLEWITTFRPAISILLNITEDHLDRYRGMNEYIAAKARIFENQTPEDFALLNIDDPLVAGFAGMIPARVFPMSQKQELAEGISHHDGFIFFRHDGREEQFPTGDFRLKGAHNTENIMAALAATLLSGCNAACAGQAVASFSGLRHRMELVQRVNGVGWYEDSKGTNVGSVVKSLESFPGNITLIAGGKDKGGSYEPLAELVRERVAHLILIGEAKQRMREALGHLTDTRFAETLENAVAEAHRLTLPGGVVLFSPACSSFDMFRDYEERAQRFIAAVQALEGDTVC
jgi:UDP-N-acetylmuramoylalanine--D-glutamate ligase